MAIKNSDPQMELNRPLNHPLAHALIETHSDRDAGAEVLGGFRAIVFHFQKNHCTRSASEISKTGCVDSNLWRRDTVPQNSLKIGQKYATVPRAQE